ncbi:hypothetical protein LINGRAHAP2_LOCUS2682 [Linum grandiflorum]
MIFSLVHSAPPSLPIFTCSFKPAAAPYGRLKPLCKLPVALTAKSPPPARDIVIDFGKYKGKMLGAIPSPYLKWISANLRSGDTLHWAQLADQVLQDAVYRDRLEWEFASRVLDGGTPSSASSSLLEISQRFGWDNDDKIGWRRVDFELLGTSKGGRIPRLESLNEEEKKKRGGSGIRAGKEEKDGGGGGGSRRGSGGDGIVEESEDRRRKERRERLRMRKAAEEEKLGVLGRDEGRLVNQGLFGGRGGDRTAEIKSRFPGREGLLKKVLEGKKRCL